MRTSAITRFAKNDRARSARRGLAALATTVVLAGGVQVLGAGSAWACGDARYGTPHKVEKPTVPSADFRTFDSNSIAADGSWTEFGLSIANFTGADVARTAPNFALASATQGVPLRTKDLRVQVLQHGAWKSLDLDVDCIGIDVDTDSLAQPLSNGRAANFMFRVSLSPDAPKGLTSLNLVTDARNDKATLESWDFRTVKVTHPRTAPAEHAGPKAPKKPAKPAPAEPAADKAPAKAAEPSKAPAATPTAAPATTALAGTPELAHTGAAENNTFLAVSSAVLLALGAGVLIAVRRLRPQR
ncbi:hypothetical protein VM98_09520 [Streptomyces rubellomurinus subsp. indigoferus]|nr:hypothetical protein VM98_09520 [Streptomyces rubellomurinus subsp. indigoferus]